MRRTIFKRAAALLTAAVSILGCLTGCSVEGQVKPAGPSAKSADTLAAAQYPERVKYPQEGVFGFDEEQYDRWAEERRERRLDSEELEAMKGYFMAALPELLSGGEDENRVCSPLNVYVALSMLAETAGGESRDQLLKLLGTEDMERQRALTKRLWDAIYNDDGTYTRLLANSLWLRSGQDDQYDPEVLKTLAEDYYASSFSGEMGSEEYNGLLRDWLNEQTGGLLGDQIGDVRLQGDVVMALASTALFGDRWEAKFSKDSVETQTFHAPGGDVEREFMKKRLDDTCFFGEKFTAVKLGFESGGHMTLLLPDEGVSVEDILSDESALAFLTGNDVPEGVENRRLYINLALPKFDLVSNGSIIEKLTDLGVKDVFDPDKADFTPLLGEDNMFDGVPVYVSQVLHGARVRVDEEGCEAAAYTLVAMVGAGAPPEETDEIDLVLDRPFIFSLMTEGVPMFAGVVSEP